MSLFVVVAHPDDESLWLGGTLLALRDREPHVVVICLTNQHNGVRSREFREACAALGAQAVLVDFPDGAHHPLRGAGARIADMIAAQSAIPFLGVVTHAPHGNERSHPQHVACFEEIRRTCLARDMPFGFFAEASPPGFVTSHEHRVGECVIAGQASINWSALLGPELSSIRARPIAPKPYVDAVRRWRYLRPQLASLTRVFRIEIDLPRKQALLSLYQSQVDGLKEYDTYRRSEEYLYADARLGDALLPFLSQCPRS
jgi:LmbE family N-acetylglucosaminyl deacetylase